MHPFKILASPCIFYILWIFVYIFYIWIFIWCVDTAWLIQFPSRFLFDYKLHLCKISHTWLTAFKSISHVFRYFSHDIFSVIVNVKHLSHFIKNGLTFMENNTLSLKKCKSSFKLNFFFKYNETQFHN